MEPKAPWWAQAIAWCLLLLPDRWLPSLAGNKVTYKKVTYKKDDTCDPG